MNANKMGNMLNGAFDQGHKSPVTKKSKHKTRSIQKPQQRSSQAKSSSATTLRYTSAVSTGQGMIPWSLALDYRSIGILDALEKLYGLSNRDEALRLLFKKPLKALVDAKGVTGKEKFELNRKVYDMNTRPKAIARHQKFGR